MANADPGFPGFTYEIARDVPTLAEQLRAAGYATFAIGKWHLTKDSSMSDASDRSSWPTQRGFDRYYGILEGLTNLHHPHRLIRDNSPVAIDEYPDGFYLTDDLTDEAIALIKAHRAESQRPFFLYFAHLAVHGPLHAKQVDLDKYAGRYAHGWTPCASSDSPGNSPTDSLRRARSCRPATASRSVRSQRGTTSIRTTKRCLRATKRRTPRWSTTSIRTSGVSSARSRHSVTSTTRS